MQHSAVHVGVLSGGLTAAQELLLAGVPVCVVPAHAAHAEVGRRLDATGAGLVVAPADVTANPAALQQAIERLVPAGSTQGDHHRLAALYVGGLLRSAGGVEKAARLVHAAAVAVVSGLPPPLVGPRAAEFGLLPYQAASMDVYLGVAVLLSVLASAASAMAYVCSSFLLGSRGGRTDAAGHASFDDGAGHDAGVVVGADGRHAGGKLKQL